MIILNELLLNRTFSVVSYLRCIFESCSLAASLCCLSSLSSDHCQLNSLGHMLLIVLKAHNRSRDVESSEHVLGLVKVAFSINLSSFKLPYRHILSQ